MSYKPDPTDETLEDALWFPEYYNWGPSQTEERFAQGGGTVRWSSSDNDWVFVTPPDWWVDCKPGDLMPREWDVL